MLDLGFRCQVSGFSGVEKDKGIRLEGRKAWRLGCPEAGMIEGLDAWKLGGRAESEKVRR